MYFNREDEYVYYESEPTAPYENEYGTYDLGEYVLPTQSRGNHVYTIEANTTANTRRTHMRVIQDEYDDDHYTLARPTTCPTKVHGNLKGPKSENKSNTKEGVGRKKGITIAILVVCLLAIAGGLTVAVVLLYRAGIVFLCLLHIANSSLQNKLSLCNY